MAVSIVGVDDATTGSAAGSSVTLNLPVGWQANDYAILCVGANPATQTFTKPSGWSQVQDETSNNLRFYVATRVLQAGDTDPVVSWTSNNQGSAGLIVLRGVDIVDPYGTALAYIEDATADTSCEHAAVTPRGADDFIVWVAAGRGATNGTSVNQSTAPTGGTGGTVTERVDVSSTRAGSPEVGVAIWTQQLSASTAISASTTTMTDSAVTSSQVFSLRTATTGITGTVAVTQANQTSSATGTIPSTWPIRGVNLSGAEFAAETHAAQSGFNDDGITRFSNTNPGVHNTDFHYDSRDSYSYTDVSSIDFLSSRGIKTIRLPLRWERMQPTLGAALDSTAVAAVTDILDEASNAGVKVILDIHNYGLYYLGSSGTRKTLGVDSETSSANFADLWSRMATAFASHAACHGFGLMNEPQGGQSNGLTASTWKSVSQAAVNAIRLVHTNVMIYVGGWQFSDLYNWAAINGSPWITDSTGRFKYEAHHYWSETDDGQYTTYAAALDYATNIRGYTAGANADANHTRILDDLNNFKSWLTTNGVDGLVGEFSWPKDADTTGDPGDQALWDAAGQRYLQELDALNLDGIMWGCGEFYGEASPDPLLVYQRASGPAPPARLSIAQPQALVLEDHLGISGEIAVTQANQTSSATGVLGYTGTVAATQDNQTSSASGQLIFSGSVAVTQDNQAATASGNVTAFGIAGTVSVTQDAQTSSASGVLEYAGSAAVTQADNTSNASAFTDPSPTSGTVAVLQANQVSLGVGTVDNLTAPSITILAVSKPSMAWLSTRPGVAELSANLPRSSWSASAPANSWAVTQPET